LLVLRHEHKAWKQTFPLTGCGFLTASPEGVAVLTIRPGPTRDVYLIRLQNSIDQATQAKLEFPMIELADAHLGSAAGDAIGAVSWSAHQVEIPMARYDVKTLVVRVQRSRE
jgi:hypothetical protein